MDFGSFSIRVPGRWKKTTDSTIHKGVERIQLDQTDIIEFNIGKNDRNIMTYQDLAVIHVNIIETEKESNYEIIETVTEDLSTVEIIKSDMQLKIIDGIEATMLIPQIPGKGAVGGPFCQPPKNRYGHREDRHIRDQSQT